MRNDDSMFAKPEHMGRVWKTSNGDLSDVDLSFPPRYIATSREHVRDAQRRLFNPRAQDDTSRMTTEFADPIAQRI